MFNLRFPGAGQPAGGNFGRRSDRARARASASSGRTAPGAPTAQPGPFDQVPFWVVPSLIVSAAMPIYGQIQNEKNIREGNARAAARLERETTSAVSSVVRKLDEATEEAKHSKWLPPAAGTALGLAVGAAAIGLSIAADRKNRDGDGKGGSL